MSFLDTTVRGLLHKSTSWVFSTFSAISAEEMTNAGTRPSRRYIISPCFRDNCCSERWGWRPTWRRLPMTGRGLGPGGSFVALPELNLLWKIMMRSNIGGKIMRRAIRVGHVRVCDEEASILLWICSSIMLQRCVMC